MRVKVASIFCLATLSFTACAGPSTPAPAPGAPSAAPSAPGIPALPVEPAPADPVKEFLASVPPAEMSVSATIRPFEVVSTENEVIRKWLPRDEITLSDKKAGFKVNHSWTGLGDKLAKKLETPGSRVLVSATTMVNPAGVLMGASTLSNSPAEVVEQPGKYLVQATCVGNGGEFFVSATASAEGKGFLLKGVCGKTEPATYEYRFSTDGKVEDEQLGTFKIATTGAPRPGVVVAKFAPAG